MSAEFKSGAVARRAIATLISGVLLMTSCATVPVPERDFEETFVAGPHASEADWALGPVMAAREADWRFGPVIYQVFVDRFAPSEDLEAKRDLYASPRRLRSWDETPVAGEYVEEAGLWSHELDFWGGDLRSLRGRLDHLVTLGVDVLYLNPIHQAYTNHKYDAQDYFEISPEYGTREDLRALTHATHGLGMRLVLDGVLNHMGRTSPWFQDALANPASPWRDWYFIGDEYEIGYRAWWNVPNLPEVNWENPVVQARLHGDPDSVIQGYLRDGVDGWRLDVAFDIGFRNLRALTDSAHRARPDALVIGEIWNYPEDWLDSIDGQMNMTARHVIYELVRGNVSPGQAGRVIERMVEDCGLEPLLRSWIVLDNHDVPRLRTDLPEEWRRRMAQVLQFTLPGAPCIYYGIEAGMEGGGDPEQRAPMRWDLITDDNPEWIWMRSLIAARQDCRALGIGEFRRLDAERLLAFTRFTDHVRDFAVVIANPSSEEVTELLVLRDSKLMSNTALVDAFTGEEFRTFSGAVSVTVPPRTIHLLRPSIPETGEYDPFKRVQ